MLYEISINFTYEVKKPNEDTIASIEDHLERFIRDEYKAESDIVIEEAGEEEGE